MREVVFVLPDGLEKILLVKKTIAENNKKLFLIANIIDITELKERKKQVMLYNKIADQISNAISVSDYSGSLIDVNEAQAKNLGKSREELIGSSITKMKKTLQPLQIGKNITILLNERKTFW